MSRIRLTETNTPATPATTKHEIFIGTDGHLKKIDDAGVVTDYDSGASYTNEDAQDAVGGILTDTATIDFTYNDVANQITADVIDGSITNAKVASGIDAVKIADGSVSNTEFQYLNGVTSAIQTQIDGKITSSRQINTNAGSGLAGGGDLTADRNLTVDITGQTAETRSDIVSDELMMWDSGSSVRKKITPVKIRYLDPDRFITNQSDFISELNGGLTATNNGTAASVQVGTYGVDLTERAQGVVQLDTGSTAAGRASLHSHQLTGMFPGSGRQRVGFRVAPEALSVAGVEQFTLYVGFIDNTAAGDQTDGAYFRYTDGVNGGRWEAVVAAGGTRYAEDTGVLVSVNYDVLEVEINAAGTQADFYINGTLVSTITTGEAGAAFPVAPTNTYGFGLKIEKSVGTGVRAVSADWFYYEFERSSAR